MKSKFLAWLAQGDRLFWGILLFYGLLVFSGLINKGPMNVHLWRQADCLSLTQHYYEGAPFLEPQMHQQMADGFSSGRTAGEFPGMYYLMAQVWKLTGMHYWSYRLLMLMLYVAGAFMFYKGLSRVLQKRWLVLSITFTLISSPAFLFYGISFLTDAPAFALVLLALGGLVYYQQSSSLKWLYLSLLAFMLAGLIKISSLIAFIFLAGVWGLEFMGVKSLGSQKLFKRPWAEAPGFLAVFGAIYAWYAYAKTYNASHGFKYTYNDIFPLWLLKSEQLGPWVKGIVSETLLVYFPYPTVVLMAILWVVNLFSYKRLPLLAWLANLLVVLGGLVYFVLWAPLFQQHDYYYIALLVLFPAIVVPFAWQIDQGSSKWFVNRPMLSKRLWIGYAAFSLLYGMQMMHLKSDLYPTRIAPVTAPRSFYHVMNWFNWHKRTYWDNYVKVREKFADWGIEPSDKVVSIPDDSFNISLFLMQQKGWTNFIGFHQPEKWDYVLNNDARFLFVGDEKWLDEPALQPYLHTKIGQFEQVQVFKLQP